MARNGTGRKTARRSIWRARRSRRWTRQHSWRMSDNSVKATRGGKAHKVRVTGFLMWDDDHGGANDVGTTVRRFSPNGYHNPWRSTTWEIHPVLKVEDLGTE